MRVPLSWLKNYIDLNLSPEKLSDLLTLAGLEVDKIRSTPFSFQGVIVGEIKETSPHPHAEKLKIAQVFDGHEVVQVVCGDPSCAAGMKVAFATIGALLTDKEGKTFKIKKSKLRSVESFGMLCAEEELGLAESSNGIMMLGDDAVVGTDLTELLGDLIFEISLTPNLGHCMSVFGIARDIGALLDQKVKKPSVLFKAAQKKSSIQVEVEDQKKCSRYCCQKVCNVKVGPSPKWLIRHLENSGMRTINNIVDITNYVMLELGQPLHAFDANKIDEQKISVKDAEKPISFTTLDGEKRHVPENTLMICDKQGPIAIAGIMGGLHSGVDETTTDVILEAACFNPSTIRQVSKTLGLRTESSARFERGIDCEGTLFALQRAASLIMEIGKGTCDEQGIDYLTQEETIKKIKVRLSKTNAILGTELSLREIDSFLKRLEMKTTEEGDTLLVTVPSYRNDIHHEIDLIEEIARIYGYNTIQKRKKAVSNSSLPHSPLYLLQKEVRKALIASGLQEFLTCDLISPDLAALSIEDHLGETEAIHVLRPSSIDQSILRTSLLPGMLQAVRKNFDWHAENIAAFEIGKIHFKEGNTYSERLTAAILLTGKTAPHHFKKPSQDVSFFDLKGILENLLEGLYIDKVSFLPTQLKSFHPGIQGEISLNGLRLGVLGEIHPDRLRRLDIEKKVYFAQIDLHDLLTSQRKERKMSPLYQYPGSTRDWTIALHQDVSIGSLFDEIQTFRSKLLKECFLLDLYESEKIGKDKKNVTLRLIYRSETSTVEQPQVDKEHKRLTENIAKKFQDFIA